MLIVIVKSDIALRPTINIEIITEMWVSCCTRQLFILHQQVWDSEAFFTVKYIVKWYDISFYIQSVWTEFVYAFCVIDQIY